MTEKFEDDCPDGGGRLPTKEEAEKVRAHLQRRRPQDRISINDTMVELRARNFVFSRATLGRLLAGTPKKTASPVTRAAEKVRLNRKDNKNAVGEKPPPETPQVIAEAVKIIEAAANRDETRFSIKELTKADTTSTMLAILENRERMALNIIIMRTMAEYPERMIVDMRSTAALVDALTVATKLSGGASIDITVGDDHHPPLNGAGNGEMKDVTPTITSLTADFAKWRNMRKTNGQGA
jgi:hypothetical protein